MSPKKRWPKSRTLVVLGVLLLILLISALRIRRLFMDDALNLAARKGDTKTITSLLNRGANVNGRSLHSMTPLMSASEAGHTKVVVFLIDKGADVNATTRSGSVLMYAASSGNEEIVRVLMKHGADPRWQNSLGNTATTTAVEKGHRKIVEMLEH